MARRRIHLVDVAALNFPDASALLLTQLMKAIVSLDLLIQTHFHFLLTKRIVGGLD